MTEFEIKHIAYSGAMVVQLHAATDLELADKDRLTAIAALRLADKARLAAIAALELTEDITEKARVTYSAAARASDCAWDAWGATKDSSMSDNDSFSICDVCGKNTLWHTVLFIISLASMIYLFI